MESFQNSTPATRSKFTGRFILKVLALFLILADFTLGDKESDLKKFSDDTLDKWVAPDFIREDYPWYVSGKDFANRTVFVVEFGKWDMKTLVEEGGYRFQLLDKYVNQALYKFSKYAEKWIQKHADYTDDDAAGAVLIMDMENYSILQMASTSTIRYVMEVTRRFLALEDKLAYGYFVNVNFLASGLIRMLRPILGTVMDKVEVFGTDPTVWVPKLSTKISLSQLPPSMGGFKSFRPLVRF